MATTKEINQQIDRLQNLDLLVRTYEEIAATNIRKIRSSVVANRDFIEEMDKIFQELKASHKAEVLQLAKRRSHKGRTTASFMEHNGKTVAVFLAANTSLYGEIVNKTFTMFVDYIQSHDTDVVIVGKLGTTLYQSHHIEKPATMFALPDNGTDQQNLRQIISFLLNYEKILIFYGQFKSIMTQTAIVTDIYGDQSQLEKATEQELPTDVMHYLYEPSLEKILAFFEAEIFASIFEQTLNESQLAKNASRMRLLDVAMQNISDTLKKEEYNRRIISHRLSNSKQVNSLTGMSLWDKQR